MLKKIQFLVYILILNSSIMKFKKLDDEKYDQKLCEQTCIDTLSLDYST